MLMLICFAGHKTSGHISSRSWRARFVCRALWSGHWIWLPNRSAFNDFGVAAAIIRYGGTNCNAHERILFVKPYERGTGHIPW